MPSQRCSVPPRPLRLRLKSNSDARLSQLIDEVESALPNLTGNPISICTRPHLKAHRGKLLSGRDELGSPVHAASFIRRREIILETQLLNRPGKLKLILAHEVFHFVWARLGNQCRANFNMLLRAELAAKARGEIGESAGSWKQGDTRNYICESFCDTAAWLYTGVKRSPEFTLATRWKSKRRAWFLSAFTAPNVRSC